MNVEELIAELLKVEDKKKPVKLDGRFSVSEIEEDEDYVDII